MIHKSVKIGEGTVIEETAVIEHSVTMKELPVQGTDFYDDVWRGLQNKGNKALIRYDARCKPIHKVMVDYLTATDIVLEIGCGMGYFAGNYIAPMCMSFLATDFSKVGIDIARKRFPLIADKFQVYDPLLSNLRDSPIKFNTIVALEFLEHIDKDVEFLTYIKPGVKVLFSVPVNEKRLHEGSEYPRGYPTHRRSYTEESLRTRYGPIIDIRTIILARPKRPWFAVAGYRK